MDLDCSSCDAAFIIFGFLPQAASSWRDTACVLLVSLTQAFDSFLCLSHPLVGIVCSACRHGKISTQLERRPPPRIGKASFRVLCHFARDLQYIVGFTVTTHTNVVRRISCWYIDVDPVPVVPPTQPTQSLDILPIL